MTKEEFATFSMALKTYYPKENLLPNKYAMDLWFGQLQDIPFNIAEMSLNKWVATNKWSPTIADIREMSTSITQGYIKDWGDGWNQVINAIKRFGMYRPEEALASMDDITRQCVKRLGFQELCISENMMADRANFRMIYEQLADRKKQEIQLPSKLQMLIEQTTQKMIGG